MNEAYELALSVFPDELKYPLLRAGEYSDAVYEIRLVADTSVYLNTSSGLRFVGKGGEVSIMPGFSVLRPTVSQLDEITDRAIGFSGFTHERELMQGFITYGGGCRIGICARGEHESFSEGKITSLCIRLPVKNEIAVNSSADALLRRSRGGILVAGAPMSGKTTLLRYIARRLSDGITGEYKRVCVIDERLELSDGCYLGFCTDVIAGKEKSRALLHAVRLLSPQYVICDEIGSVNETNALIQGLNSGVTFIASVHAADLESLILRRQFRILFSENVFSDVILLSGEEPGKITQIYSRGELSDAMDRNLGCLSVT